jgi:hypothetical protein
MKISPQQIVLWVIITVAAGFLAALGEALFTALF